MHRGKDLEVYVEELRELMQEGRRGRIRGGIEKTDARRRRGWIVEELRRLLQEGGEDG